MRRIIDVWDDHKEGAINLLEFSEIVRDLQVALRGEAREGGWSFPALPCSAFPCPACLAFRCST